MLKSILQDGGLKLLGLIVITIIFTYFTPRVVSVTWYIVLLFLYYRSNDEPFWLIFFLVTTDGFMGFLGTSEVTIKALPGLPAIELTQFYIVLNFIKAVRQKPVFSLFYLKYLQILLIYALFFIFWGQALGYSGELNEYFRIVKLFVPLLLFYSIPRLFYRFDQLDRLFGFASLILIFAFFTEVYTLVTGNPPIGTSSLSTKAKIPEETEFRSFYNPSITLIALLGSVFTISYDQPASRKNILAYLIITISFGMAFLSATRGWIIGFGFIIILSVLLNFKKGSNLLKGLFIIGAFLFLAGFGNDKIREQVYFSKGRLLKLESISRGDLTAEGSLQRLDTRGPRVMNKWKENPIFGWGLSNVAKEYADGHVGNQNLLMSTGIAGYSLLIGFILFICISLYNASRRAKNIHYLKTTSLIILIYLLGWFIIHSTSVQQFSYLGMPIQIIPQAVFLSLAGLVYSQSIVYNGENYR